MARQEPVPEQAWRLFMRWEKLLFCHWEVPAERLRPLVPPNLELDLFGGSAYVGVVPFTMTGIRFRGVPTLPFCDRFHELNVRTYVRHEGRPGVWFISLDANHKMAVRAARAWFHLRYFDCGLSLREEKGWIRYTAQRPGGQTSYHPFPTPRFQPSRLDALYRPLEPHEPDELDRFLTERYSLYSYSARGHLYRGEINHEPWPLFKAEAEITVNTMANGLGFDFPGTPRLLYSHSLDVVAWPPERLA